MSQSVEAKTGPAIGALHEVRATFGTPEALQEAVGRLETAGFDRADLSLPEIMTGQETPDAGARPVDTEEDARQARTLHTSGAAAVAGMAAAGGVIATGGAAAPRAFSFLRSIRVMSSGGAPRKRYCAILAARTWR